MSIDIEDWFQVENLKKAIPLSSWESCESRVQNNVDRMLDVLARHQITCTCFILGWIAERFPGLVRRVSEAGHEIASHGYGHELVYNLTPEQLYDGVKKTKDLLESITGRMVRGYRAPNFSITDWAILVLQRAGYGYDSSFFPAAAHDRYGKLAMLQGRQGIAELLPGFYEVPISCLNVGGKGLPWGGGGYFRLLPYPIFRQGMRRIQAASPPYVFYLHPWEIDPGQPRVKGLPWLYAFRHYVNLDVCAKKWERLLTDFQWTSISTLLPTKIISAAN